MIALALVLAARVVTLDDAVQSAREHQPQLRQARAGTAAAEARTREALAPLLPQLGATGSYNRRISGGGQPFITSSGASSSANHSWSDSVTAQMTVFDFFSTIDRFRSAGAAADAQAATERATALQIDFNVRSAFFDARARRALVQVARDNLANTEKHLRQTEGFVQAGTHPEIDVIQARADTANARLQLIQAENAYQTSKVSLNAAMGVQGPTDFDIADVQMPAIEGEDAAVDVLLEEASRSRPEVRSLEDLVRANQLTVSSLRAQYWPSIGANAGFAQTGPTLDNLSWRLSVGATLTWNVFQGGLTRAQVSEAEANVVSALAQLDQQRLQIRSDVDGARLAVRAAKESIGATQEALLNARERLRLAEERYAVGVGNAIELGDAQLALVQAQAQAVQADDTLSTARAQLSRALGRQ